MSEDVFYNALESQISLKTELMYHLDNESDAAFNSDLVSKEGQLALSQWINNEGQQYWHLPAFKKLTDVHENLHKCAAEVIRAKDSGQTQLATDIFMNHYIKLSKRITHILVRLNSSVNGHNNQLFV